MQVTNKQFQRTNKQPTISLHICALENNVEPYLSKEKPGRKLTIVTFERIKIFFRIFFILISIKHICRDSAKYAPFLLLKIYLTPKYP